MDNKLLKEALIKYVSGIILVAALLFIPAGTLKWKNGWIFMAVLFIPMFIAGLIMFYKAPDLLKSRLDVKEKQKQLHTNKQNEMNDRIPDDVRESEDECNIPQS